MLLLKEIVGQLRLKCLGRFKMGIEGLLKRLIALLEEALSLLVGNGASEIRFLVNGKEITNMANVPINVGQKVPYLVQEVAADGTVVAPLVTDKVTVVSANSGAITVLPDITKAPNSIDSGFLAANAAALGVIVTATVTKADGTVLGTAKTVTFDVSAVAPVATDIVFTVGAAIPQ